MASRRRTRRKRARDVLAQITTSPNGVLMVHYSCEGFYDRDVPDSPRITSIAARIFESGQTISWSIHQVAEVNHALGDIEERYDDLEREMLEQFYSFASGHQDARWIHWNMRDINYGFEALAHRMRVLGGEPMEIPEHNRIDLARLLVDLYGVRYIGHPRLQRLVEANRITNQGFLTGADEAAAFDNREYVKLHQSTLRKVDVLSGIAERAADGTLQHNARWYEVHGFDVAGIYEAVTEHWLWRLASLLALPASLALGALTLVHYL